VELALRIAPELKIHNRIPEIYFKAGCKENTAGWACMEREESGAVQQREFFPQWRKLPGKTDTREGRV